MLWWMKQGGTLVDTAHVVINLLFAGTGGSLVLVAIAVFGDTALAAGEVDDLDGLGGELAVLDTGDGDIGTVVVVLGQLVGGPGPDEQALVLLGARGDVGGDLDGPLVVGCRSKVRHALVRLFLGANTKDTILARVRGGGPTTQRI